MQKKARGPLCPSERAKQKLLTAILDGSYPPGTALPSERVLALCVGVTRPTLRETLKSLSAEGWITTHHGKPTLVNDCWKKGGLAVLGTLARFGEFLPADCITHLFELRVVLMPAFARRAGENAPDALLNHLAGAGNLPDDAESFTDYDWKLQTLMAEHASNRIFPLILNDFAPLFKKLASGYFKHEKGRRASRAYYRRLSRAVTLGGKSIETSVRRAMQESIDIFQELTAQGKETPNAAMERLGR
jgi:GntR family negative regulator for fad regulon and positive regulator of fabA